LVNGITEKKEYFVYNNIIGLKSTSLPLYYLFPF